MTRKEFLNKIANGKDDFLQSFLDIVGKGKVKFCAIGGLAVNAYAEPVVSLDLDVIIVNEKIEELLPKLKKHFKVENFVNRINVSEKGSDLRIQIQTDERYQEFLVRAKVKDVLGYKIPVAAIEDVFQGKVWAAMDETRRPSEPARSNRWAKPAEAKRVSNLAKAGKRQKDLADILRLIEAKAGLKNLLPGELIKQLKLS